MQITKTNNNGFLPVFKANLYYKNERLSNWLFSNANISESGNRNTDIFVKEVVSKPIGYDYHNSVSFEINNPLLGSKGFFVNNMHKTNRNITKEELSCKDEIYRFFCCSDYVKRFEDETLKETLLRKINEAASINYKLCNNAEEISPERIFEKMLVENNPEKLGFSSERIKDLKRVAKNLSNEIMLTGSDSLLKRIKINKFK